VRFDLILIIFIHYTQHTQYTIALTSRNESIIMDVSHRKTDKNADNLNEYEICLTDKW